MSAAPAPNTIITIASPESTERDPLGVRPRRNTTPIQKMQAVVENLRKDNAALAKEVAGLRARARCVEQRLAERQSARAELEAVVERTRRERGLYMDRYNRMKATREAGLWAPYKDCPWCKNVFDNGVHGIRLLDCGHAVCHVCATQLAEDAYMRGGDETGPYKLAACVLCSTRTELHWDCSAKQLTHIPML